MQESADPTTTQSAVLLKQRWAQGLTYAGALPFVGCAVLGIFFPSVWWDQLIITYGVVIVSFLAGVHWGIYLYRDVPFNLFVRSNILALLAWGVLFLPMLNAVVGLILCLIYQYVIDRKLAAENLHAEWFSSLRTRITLIVLLALSGFLALRLYMLFFIMELQ